MKVFLAVLCFVALSSAEWVATDTGITYSRAEKTPVKSGGMCSFCVQFTGEALDALLNIILNAGVVGGCADLCGELASKTGNKDLGEVCDVLCAAVGIKEFIDIIQKADLDPIYMCELLDLCKVNDHGDATITSLTITPEKGPQQTTFTIAMQWTSKNGTGTGLVTIDVDTVDGIPLGDSELNPDSPPGTYGVKWQIQTQPSQNCQEPPCEEWLPGVYNITVGVCNGDCGNKHPHSGVYDTKAGNFSISE